MRLDELNYIADILSLKRISAFLLTKVKRLTQDGTLTIDNDYDNLYQ